MHRNQFVAGALQQARAQGGGARGPAVVALLHVSAGGVEYYSPRVVDYGGALSLGQVVARAAKRRRQLQTHPHKRR